MRFAGARRLLPCEVAGRCIDLAMRQLLTVFAVDGVLLTTHGGHAGTITVDVTDDLFLPSKIQVQHGDKVIFHNQSTILHSVHLVGHVFRFGKKHFIHDALIYPRRAYVSFNVHVGRRSAP